MMTWVTMGARLFKKPSMTLQLENWKTLGQRNSISRGGMVCVGHMGSMPVMDHLTCDLAKVTLLQLPCPLNEM
jgi:hypothetical protein